MLSGHDSSFRDQPAWLRRAPFRARCDLPQARSAGRRNAERVTATVTPTVMTSGTTRSAAFPTETRSGQIYSAVPWTHSIKRITKNRVARRIDNAQHDQSGFAHRQAGRRCRSDLGSESIAEAVLTGKPRIRLVAEAAVLLHKKFAVAG